MAIPLVTVDREQFQMIPYVIILKVRRFYLPTTYRFGTVEFRLSVSPQV